MSPLVMGALIIGGAIVGFVLLSLIMRGATAAVGASARKRIEARFKPEEIVHQDEMANSFGLTSKGAIQVREGNGGLVLTQDTLSFLPLIGKDLIIPRADITGASSVKSHLGKSVFRPLLKVDFAGDSIAFFVPDVPAWLRVPEKK